MSQFQGAINTTIRGGHFTAVSNTGAIVGSSKDVVSLLLSHSATAGLLDAAERFDAPKCDNGTRVSMLREMKYFAQQAGGPSIYWLHGPAGIGKSALAQSLALSLQSEGDHAASFFFSRTAPGRNDGNQLIVTLACQLVLSIPPLKPLILKVLKGNPIILKATNAIKMQRLIVDPLNQLSKMARWDPRLLVRRVIKGKLHPRLILVDGLDECDDIQVQRDILLCIGEAVTQLSLPFRFVIASRPESHILETFELDPVFQELGKGLFIAKNLGEDEDADEQITTFLVREFAEIRRTHPIREFLPQRWPRSGQIGQLVLKSSKGFIYPATVIRYIKMPNNRPDECLERILGLSEIPITDKPYEPIDVLYRYIFESVPDVHKQSIHEIFHFLVAPGVLDDLTVPWVIEQHFKYKPGHVQHVLRDLLCLVEFPRNGRIKVLHASLPDFLLDRSRSGSLFIDIGDVHATLAVCLYDLSGPDRRIHQTKMFGDFLAHFLQANTTDRLTQIIAEFNLVNEYKYFCQDIHATDEEGLHNRDFAQEQPLEWFAQGIVSITAYLVALFVKGVASAKIMSHFQALETYTVQQCALASALQAVGADIQINIIPNLADSAMIHNHECFQTIFASNFTRPQLSSQISKLCLMLLSVLFTLPVGQNKPTIHHEVDTEMTLEQRHTEIAHTLLPFFISNSWEPEIDRMDLQSKLLRPIATQVAMISLTKSAYSANLVSQIQRFLEVAEDEHCNKAYANHGIPVETVMMSCLQQLAPVIVDYLRRVQVAFSLQSSENQYLQSLGDRYQLAARFSNHSTSN